MNENDVTQISELFGVPKEIVEGSVKDGTLGVRLKDAISKKYVDNTTLETFKKNYANEVKEAYFNELVNGAKKGDIPQELYKPIKGSSLQQKEREFAKKYDVSEYTDLDDLVEKAIKKTTANGKNLPEYETKIEELKNANKKLLQEKEEAVKTVESKYRNQFIEREKIDIVNKVPHDFSGFKADEAEGVKVKTRNMLKAVFDGDGYKLDYDEKGRFIVMKDGNIIKNQATLEPVDPLDVMIDLAKSYGQKLISPDKGGQGGQSSQKSGSEFSDYESFIRWCNAKNIQPTSQEAITAWAKSGLMNKR